MKKQEILNELGSLRFRVSEGLDSLNVKLFFTAIALLVVCVVGLVTCCTIDRNAGYLEDRIEYLEASEKCNNSNFAQKYDLDILESSFKSLQSVVSERNTEEWEAEQKESADLETQWKKAVIKYLETK